MESAFTNFKIENLESECKENQIIIKGHVIANIKEKDEIPIIKSKINNIVKNKDISRILISLRTSRQILLTLLTDINQWASPISQTIESGDYDVKANDVQLFWILLKSMFFWFSLLSDSR